MGCTRYKRAMRWKLYALYVQFTFCSQTVNCEYQQTPARAYASVPVKSPEDYQNIYDFRILQSKT